MLESSLLCDVTPVCSMFFKEQTRDMCPSLAAWGHLMDETLLLGAAGGHSGPVSAKDICNFLVEEIKGITQVGGGAFCHRSRRHHTLQLPP